MMLIATGLAAAMIAAASYVPDAADVPADSGSAFAPPVVVNVVAGPSVSATLVTRLLDEALAIWRPTGLEIVWRRVAPEVLPYARPGGAGPSQSTLRVDIGDNPGVTRDARTPLGWIVFDSEHDPQPEIYLSYLNATELMASAARGVVGAIDQMPLAQREILLARAMGRALAHELGHFLLASKVHTPRGLLKAWRTTAELFTAERAGFKIDAAQRQQIAARLRGAAMVVSR